VRATLESGVPAGGYTVTFEVRTRDGSWQQLGKQLIGTSPTSVFNSLSDFEIGSQQYGTSSLWMGNVYEVLVERAPGEVAARFMPSEASASDVASFAGTDGRTYTVHTSGALVARINKSPVRLVDVAANIPRCRYRPSDGAYNGILIEPATTNYQRNGNFSGAVVGVIGSGGALPTNWFASTFASTNLNTEIVGFGEEDGVPYIDVRVSGTSNGTSYTLQFETNTNAVAVQNEVWTLSVFTRLVGGSHNGLPSAAATVYINTYTAAGAFDAVTTAVHAKDFTPTSRPLLTQRQWKTRSLGSATTARVNGGVFWTVTNGAAIDCTMRFAAPQLEKRYGPTSIAKATGSNASRGNDFLSYPVGGGVSQAEGTVVAECTPAAALIAESSFSKHVFVITNGTSNNRLIPAYFQSGVVASFSDSNGSSSNAVGLPSQNIVDSTVKIASGWERGVLGIECTGFTGASDVDGVAFTSEPNVIYIGQSYLGAASLNGCVREVSVYNKRMGGSAMQRAIA